MRRGYFIGLAVCGPFAVSLSFAVEPPAKPSAPASAPAAQVTKPAATARPPLDLRIGDIRKYMTPEEFRALSAPVDESNTVVVQANAPLLPMRSALDVPGGIVAPFWALVHPTQAWRLLAPDPRAKEIPPPDHKIPPPEFRWGP